MRIFVTGATGVLGCPVVRLLVNAGHHVSALSRSPENTIRILKAGARPVRASLFDPESLFRAVAGMDAVLHLATRIPPAAKASKLEAWKENDRIRFEGTRNLVDAALVSGVGAFVYPSVTFIYPDRGAEWVDVETAATPSRLLESTLQAEAEIVPFSWCGQRGITLRMGAFYGPSSPHTQEVFDWARRGIAMFFGSRDAYQSVIWIDDAARAVVAALLRAPAGTYDVVDDEPMTRAEIASALAEAVGRRRLLRPPKILLRIMAGEHATFLTRSQRVSNRRFRDETGWRPNVPNAREGFKRLAVEYSTLFAPRAASAPGQIPNPAAERETA